MFQSDDFDDILLSQDFPEIESQISRVRSPTPEKQIDICETSETYETSKPTPVVEFENKSYQKRKDVDNGSPKRRKRKFPGPAGLLPENYCENAHNTENVIPSSQMFSQNPYSSSTFEEPPWQTLERDLSKRTSGPARTDISQIKARPLLRRVPLVAAIVSLVDRTLETPSIALKDRTGEIQGTLHRDAWELYGSCLAPRRSAVLLRNVPVLTAGGSIRTNHLNVTVNNVEAVYCDLESRLPSSNGDPSELVSETLGDVFVLRNPAVSRRAHEDRSMDDDPMSGIDADSFLDDF